jgi:hypothetical protein
MRCRLKREVSATIRCRDVSNVVFPVFLSIFSFLDINIFLILKIAKRYQSSLDLQF